MRSSTRCSDRNGRGLFSLDLLINLYNQGYGSSGSPGRPSTGRLSSDNPFFSRRPLIRRLTLLTTLTGLRYPRPSFNFSSFTSGTRGLVRTRRRWRGSPYPDILSSGPSSHTTPGRGRGCPDSSDSFCLERNLLADEDYHRSGDRPDCSRCNRRWTRTNLSNSRPPKRYFKCLDPTPRYSLGMLRY